MSDQFAQQMVEQFAIDFDKADKDKNGSLSLQEVVEVLRSGGFRGSDDEIKTFFDTLDKNKDDKISKDEFKDVMFKLPQMSMRELELRQKFLQIDKDRSGYISSAEVFDAMAPREGISRETINELFDYLSRDADRKVSYDEFLEALGFEESASFLNKIFCHMDKDNSGYLTLDEINSALKSEGELKKMRPYLLQLLEYHAKDDDKKINYKEFVQAWLSKKKEVRKA